MSSLAGVIMAAAAEGIGALDLAGFGSSPDKRVAGVVNEALSRHSIKAPARPRCRPLPPRRCAAGHGHHDDHPREDHPPRKDAREHAKPPAAAPGRARGGP